MVSAKIGFLNQRYFRVASCQDLRLAVDVLMHKLSACLTLIDELDMFIT